MRLHQRLAVLLALVLCTGSTGAQGQTGTRSDVRVTLLGSGIPVPQPDRFGPATLVEAGGQKLLFDAGRGATVRLFQLHVPLREVGPLFEHRLPILGCHAASHRPHLEAIALHGTPVAGLAWHPSCKKCGP